MNWTQLRGMWNQLAGAAKRRWGKLTDDDLSVVEGDRDRLVGKIQERYGVSKEEAQKQIDDWLSSI